MTAARTSADWYEKFPEHMRLGLMDFAYSYITRSGRIDDARLRAMSPAFMARYEASTAAARREHAMMSPKPDAAHLIADGVPPDSPGALRDRLYDSANATTPAPSCSTICGKVAATGWR